MMVKPPADSEWSVPMNADTIDIFPTVAHEVGIDIPSQVAGTAWQSNHDTEFRITENIWETDLYQISVEEDGFKGIFSFDSIPIGEYRRPTESEVDDGPLHEEFYTISEVRDGNYQTTESTIPQDIEKEIRAEMKSFICGSTDSTLDESSEHIAVNASTQKRLEHLGYK